MALAEQEDSSINRFCVTTVPISITKTIILMMVVIIEIMMRTMLIMTNGDTAAGYGGGGSSSSSDGNGDYSILEDCSTQ